MLKNIFTTILIFLTLVIFEASILSNVRILPAVPDLLLLCTVYMALLNGRGAGAVYGFVSGLFMDFISGAPLGFNCVFRTIVCYIAGFFGGFLDYTGVFMPCVIGFVASCSKVILIWLVSLFYPSIIINYNPFSVPFVFELACNTFLTPVIFRLSKIFRPILSFNAANELEEF